MMDTEILGMLEDLGRTSVARLTPMVVLNGATADQRRRDLLTAIRGTILPRRLEFTASDGAVLAIEVNSSRITDVFRCDGHTKPDFETNTRAELTDKLALLIATVAEVPGPIEMISLRPDAPLEADDVGITYSEVETACAKIAFLEEAEVQEPQETDEPEHKALEETAPQPSNTLEDGLANQFFEGSSRFAQGRVLITAGDGTALKSDGICAEGQSARPDAELLTRFARDLAGWHSDSETALTQPQLIVMRPSGGQGTGLSVLCDGQETAVTLHETRKLGAAVNLWKTLRSASE